MGVVDVVRATEDFFRVVLNKDASVIAVVPTEDGWNVRAEVIEDIEYLRERAKDDVVALYEVQLDRLLNVLGFDRIDMRERDDFGSKG